ncbi:MAG: serine/threonine-protein kinase [Pirellulales bacterium]
MPTSNSAAQFRSSPSTSGTSKQLSWHAEELIAEFEKSIRDKSGFDLDSALKTVPASEQSKLVTEIACIELEYSFAHEQQPEVSRFLSTHAALFSDPNLRGELAREHYRLLRLHNVPVDRKTVGDKYQVDAQNWAELPLGNSIIASSPFPKTGTQFCGYPLIAELGEGALGRVYLARQPDLASRLVVLKVTRYLTTEASELAKLQHAGVIPVYSIHQHAGLFAICMPYLGAITLAHLLRDSRVFGKSKCDDENQCRQLASTLVSSRLSMIASTVRVTPASAPAQSDIQPSEIHSSEQIKTIESPVEAANIASQSDVTSPISPSPGEDSIFQLLGLGELAKSLCEKILSRPKMEAKVDLMLGIVQAVSHAHQRNLVHHDLKPENILIANDGRPVLLDFNLAQSHQSQVSVGGGTIPYMSAQHLQSLQGSAKPSPTNDIFSLGVIFYQLLTGQLPYPGNDVSALFKLTQDRRTLPINMQVFDGSIPPSLCSIVNRCLAFAPEDRYQSAIELQQDLDRHVNNLPLRYAPDRSLVERTKKWIRRHPLLTSNATLISLAAVVVIALGFAWNSSLRSTERFEISRKYRKALSVLPETLAMLQSPGVEPELFEKGLSSGWGILSILHFKPNDPQHFGLMKFEMLEPSEQQKVREDLGTLLFSMASAQLQLSIVDSSNAESTIEQAKTWNRLAGELSTKLKLPVDSQEMRIQQLQRGESDEALIAEHFQDKRNDSTFAKMLAAHQQGLTAQWESLAETLVSEGPTDPSRWFSLASAKLAKGELKSALSSMDVAVRLQPKSMTATFWRGVFRLKSNDFTGAKTDFTACLHQESDLLAARYNRALALKALGENAAALEDLNWIIQQRQASPRIYSLRSQLNAAVGDIQTAKADVQAALAAKPFAADDWVARGVLKIQSDPKGALADFEQALKLDSSNMAAHFNSAHVCSEMLGDLPSAISSLTALEKSAQESASVIASRGILYARNKQVAEAISDAKTAAKLQPAALEMLQIAGIYSLVASDEVDLSKAATWLARSIAANSDMESLAVQDPDLAKLRSSPKFAQILGK